MSITVSRCLLLHSVLAYKSAEIRTLDEIIFAANHPQAPCPSLPRELLLLVRSWLLPGIIEGLMEESSAAMALYQRSLRDLLCTDCIAYNADIYGPDIWQWDQFTGPCACINHRQSPGSHRRLEHNGLHTTALPNPKQYLDAYHWLENHLSLRVVPGLHPSIISRGHHASSDTLSPVTTSISSVQSDIWGMVYEVLRGYECEVVRETDHGTTASSRCSRTKQTPSKRAVIRIVPLPTSITAEVTGIPYRSSMGLISQFSEEERWRQDTLIRRVRRDLGLCMDYSDTFERSFLIDRTALHGHGHGRRPLEVSTMFFLHSLSIRPLCQSLHLTASLAAACLSLPITLATVALTIICFYSRPKSFRLL
ncbi:hypothetical protein CVT24_007843 [Panaeolus cyanescens]|uniref:Uncharacterized protein n=1 Tax=Panaeolus cyanescens TaxID=181874 RepID=A0A409VZG1_9AGAR|nr:hypothetical protein CVT24_007843 [Panaeolus cyanescens]